MRSSDGAAAAAAAAPESLKSLIYDDSSEHPLSLKVLDQLLIPDEKKYIDIPNVQATWSVIRDMNIRGRSVIFVIPGSVPASADSNGKIKQDEAFISNFV